MGTYLIIHESKQGKLSLLEDRTYEDYDSVLEKSKEIAKDSDDTIVIVEAISKCYGERIMKEQKFQYRGEVISPIKWSNY